VKGAKELKLASRKQIHNDYITVWKRADTTYTVESNFNDAVSSQDDFEVIYNAMYSSLRNKRSNQQNQ